MDHKVNNRMRRKVEKYGLESVAREEKVISYGKLHDSLCLVKESVCE